MIVAKRISDRVKSVLAVAAALAVGGVFVAGASASTTTFAQVRQATPVNANVFSYTESGIAGSGGTATISAVSVPVNFSFESEPGLAAELQGSQDATLTLTIESNSPVVSLLGNTLATESFGIRDFTASLSITRDAAAAEGTGTRTNLLTAQFSGSELVGATATGSAGLDANSIGGLTYSSDFLSFPNNVSQDLTLAFSSWVSAVDGGGVEVDSASNFLQSATFAGAGTFDTTFVPEPGTAALVGACMLPLLLVRRRRAAH